MVKCKELTYDEAIADGWEMTGDGFWFKETSGQSGTRGVCLLYTSDAADE